MSKTFAEVAKEKGWGTHGFGLGQKAKDSKDRILAGTTGTNFQPTQEDLARLGEMLSGRKEPVLLEEEDDTDE